MIAITARKMLQLRKERRVRKFSDVFRGADAEAEAAMMSPRPSTAFRRFFGSMIPAQPLASLQARMDPSWPSASGARLTLLAL